jgi:hypothetical protein
MRRSARLWALTDHNTETNIMLHYYMISAEARVRRQDAERERQRRYWLHQARANGTLKEGGLLSKIRSFSFRIGNPSAREAVPTISPARTTIC